MSASSSTPVRAAYEALAARGALTLDPAQLEAASHFDRIIAELAAARPRRMFGFREKPRPVRGLYLHGEVGRGKTMLMDLFFAAVPNKEKRRVHFHEFMDEVHQGVAAFRKTTRGSNDNADPIEAVVRPMLKAGLRVLCLDEFHVHDITNAMLLDRLFDKLFAGGVVLVSTSNVVPDGLYKDGLNRQLFLPFIERLKRETEVVGLPSEQDYRRLKFAGQQVYVFGTGPQVAAEMDALWLRLTGGEEGAPGVIESIGREIAVPRIAMGAARFGFADLCDKPLGTRDFVRIAHSFDTLMLEDVPQMDRTRSDAAKRFILLIDSLYDRGVKLAASFAVPLDQLGKDDRTAFEFQRTISRLTEMQSEEYLGKGLREVASEVGA
ncbi:MAG: AFG1 family ATPase [Devosia sp.]|jgi:cell division protein ZapE|uniref:cell division protein ZapE n=1 Tax=unclassified Devosia TaxID=196773 RepID=UPI001A101D2B|nr:MULTISPECIES: cell division protein ZapE [unclassified Devosia]MBF0677646.1 AFG1 family ATPase [Devosia sp.]WEJ34296.1 cell division protein ZapE [Devosia sp. SD17-2]